MSILLEDKKPKLEESSKDETMKKEDTIENETGQREDLGDSLAEDKVDFWDYLDELNEEDGLAYSSIQTEEIEEEIDERTDLEIVVDFIRDRTRQSLLTSKTLLKEENENIENIDDLLEEAKEDGNCQDIVAMEGDKDIYFYSSESMTANYAMIALFVEEKNLPKTIAEMVRWNCKTYPCPTPLYYFTRTPYNYSDEQVEKAVETMKKDDRYQDIGELTTGNNVRYLFSTLHMSEKYARALAESVEYGEYGYRV